MNLFDNPSLTELSVLIAHNANYYSDYDVMVDHDGEVMIEPAVFMTQKRLNKYKFYFRGLHGKSQIGVMAAKNLRYLNQLFKNLVYCWENNLKGVIDYDEISGIQTINQWLEINKISTNTDTTDIMSYFFKNEPDSRISH